MMSNSTRVKKVVKLIASLGFSVGVLGSVTWLMFRNPGEVLALLRKTDIGLLILSVAALMVALTQFAYAAAINLRMLGYPVSFPRVGKAFFWSQLGKYVPGKILLFVIRGKMYSNYGIPARAAALSMTLEIFFSVAAAIIVAIIALPFSHSLGALINPFWAIAALGVTLGFCSPRVINWVIAKINRNKNASTEKRTINLSQIFQLLVINISVWISIGLAFVLLIRACMQLKIIWLPELIGSFAISFLAGFVTPFAPGGLGPRELALTGLLASQMDISRAATIAIIARCWWILAELGCILVFTAVCRRENNKGIGKHLPHSRGFEKWISTDQQIDQ